MECRGADDAEVTRVSGVLAGPEVDAVNRAIRTRLTIGYALQHFWLGGVYLFVIMRIVAIRV